MELPSPLDPAAFDLSALAAAADGFSGAEIEAAIVAALYSAFAEKAALSSPHILAELQRSVPLSRTCRESIEELRAWARGRTVPAAAEPLRSTTTAA